MFSILLRAGPPSPLSSLLVCSFFGLSEPESDSSMLGPALFEPLWSGILKSMCSFSKCNLLRHRKHPYLLFLQVLINKTIALIPGSSMQVFTVLSSLGEIAAMAAGRRQSIWEFLSKLHSFPFLVL